MLTPESGMLLERRVTLHVPFRPARTAPGRWLRRGLRLLHLVRPCTVEIVLHEMPSLHVTEYLQMVTANAQQAFAGGFTPTTDVLDVLRDRFAVLKEQLKKAVGIYVHITGIDDREFWESLSQRQLDEVLVAYEACNPQIAEVRANLAELVEQVGDIVRAATMAGTPAAPAGNPPEDGSASEE